MGIQPQRSGDVAMPQGLLYNRRVHILVDQKRGKGVAQDMKPKSRLFAFIWFQNPGGDCSGPQVVFNQHICYPRLLSLELEAGEAPVRVLSIQTLLAPTLKMAD